MTIDTSPEALPRMRVEARARILPPEAILALIDALEEARAEINSLNAEIDAALNQAHAK